MNLPFHAAVWREGNWFVSQCLDIDVASQGESETEVLANLREALVLHLEEPCASRPPAVRLIVVGA
ncbi:MAG: type II toxin-antitoxin system HicB family antitoxin [Acidobacteria bacterium]|nr:type II toxin-antitoxin system HicB family antitoxin [Acidobacteriota bacterium]